MTNVVREVMLLGAGGMLGRAFSRRLADAGIAVQTWDVPRRDLGDRAQVEALPVHEVDTLINCAAWTDVDGAEAREEAATVLNGDAVGWLAGRCAEHGTRFVHFSTDYVFDGRADRPYAIDHPRSPVNAYGRSKAAGELSMLATDADALLVRTSWLYAPWGKNFVRTMAGLGRTRDSLRVVDDQRGRPTSAEQLAGTTLELLQCGHRGVVHVTDGGECTWYELAKAVVEQVAPQCRVEPCTTAEFPRPAPRPAYSVLDLGPVETALGRPMVDWRESVRDVVARLESD
jgi:dTDP-4-dehydrorhamnose reductase